LDALLDISGVSSSRGNEMRNTNGSNAERNGIHCPDIFLGNGLSMGYFTANDKQSLIQVLTTALIYAFFVGMQDLCMLS
jgi:hypothetical protein